MKFEYKYSGFSLKILDDSYSKDILDFYYRNRDDFDRYEPEKPDNFYTNSFIKNMTKAEYNAFVKGNYARFFMFLDSDPYNIVGSVSFSNISTGDNKSCNIGYKVDKSYRNQGLATLMVHTALGIMTTEKKLHRIEAYILPENEASVCIAKKLNFVDEGTAHSYAKINGSWQNHRRFVYINPV